MLRRAARFVFAAASLAAPSGCAGRAEAPVQFACQDCARTDLLVGEPLTVRASLGANEPVAVTVHCSLVCHVDSSHDDPQVTFVTAEQPGLLQVTLDLVNPYTGQHERYTPPAVEVHAPESIELLCETHEGGTFARCGAEPFDRRASPQVVVMAHRGGTSRALYRAFANGQRVRAVRDPFGKVAWVHRYMGFARPEEKDLEFKGWSLRPGTHAFRVEAAGVAAEATVDVR